METDRIGSAFRAIRIRRGWRQRDVAERAGVPREVVSRIECGRAGRLPLETIRVVANSLGITVRVDLTWPGGDLDRVLNAGHAALHEALAGFFRSLPDWTPVPEVSFSIYGERGVIDIVAWHPASRSLLIIELKTALVDPQELVGTMDQRVRLGREIARQRGWKATTVSSWVILAEGSTNRRRARQHQGLLRGAFPADGHAMRAWLHQPAGPIAALSFWSYVGAGPTSRLPCQGRRVRVAPNAASSA
jgi:transcriptional regulator with XRE-family HTH domain